MSASGLPPRVSAPLDAPDAAQLIDAVTALLRDDLMPRMTGADRWNLRIATNALALASREIANGPRVISDHNARLADLGFENDRDLCAAIRAGETDRRLSEIIDAVERSVEDSLRIANPEYSTPRSAPQEPR